MRYALVEFLGLVVFRSAIINMKRIILAAMVIAAMITNNAHATVYDVNRSFGNGSTIIATLTGTLDIPIGSYTSRIPVPVLLQLSISL